MHKLISLYVDAQSRIKAIGKDEKGATMVEYALMVALIAVVCVGAVAAVGGGTSGTFTEIQKSLFGGA